MNESYQKTQENAKAKKLRLHQKFDQEAQKLTKLNKMPLELRTSDNYYNLVDEILDEQSNLLTQLGVNFENVEVFIYRKIRESGQKAGQPINTSGIYTDIRIVNDEDFKKAVDWFIDGMVKDGLLTSGDIPNLTEKGYNRIWGLY